MTDATLEQLQEQIRELRAENSQLKGQLDLREENRLLKEQNDALADEAIKASYQQAADWVKMVNSVTWTLSSIYLVAAIIALNGAMQLKDFPWRPLIAIVFILLCF